MKNKYNIKKNNYTKKKRIRIKSGKNKNRSFSKIPKYKGGEPTPKFSDNFPKLPSSDSISSKLSKVGDSVLKGIKKTGTIARSAIKHIANPSDVHRILFKNAYFIKFINVEEIQNIYCRGKDGDCIKISSDGYIYNKNNNDTTNKQNDEENSQKNDEENDGEKNTDTNKIIQQFLNRKSTYESIDYLKNGANRLSFLKLNDKLLSDIDDPENTNFIHFDGKYKYFFQFLHIYKYQFSRVLWSLQNLDESAWSDLKFLITQISNYIEKEKNIDEDNQEIKDKILMFNEFMKLKMGPILNKLFGVIGNGFYYILEDVIKKDETKVDLNIESVLESLRGNNQEQVRTGGGDDDSYVNKSLNYVNKKVGKQFENVKNVTKGLYDTTKGIVTLQPKEVAKGLYDTTKSAVSIGTDAAKNLVLTPLKNTALTAINNLSPESRIYMLLKQYFDIDKEKGTLQVSTRNYPDFMKQYASFSLSKIEKILNTEGIQRIINGNIITGAQSGQIFKFFKLSELNDESTFGSQNITDDQLKNEKILEYINKEINFTEFSEKDLTNLVQTLSTNVKKLVNVWKPKRIIGGGNITKKRKLKNNTSFNKASVQRSTVGIDSKKTRKIIGGADYFIDNLKFLLKKCYENMVNNIINNLNYNIYYNLGENDVGENTELGSKKSNDDIINNKLDAIDFFTEILNRSLRADLIVCNSATNVTNNLFFVKAYGSPQCTMTVLIQLKIISQFSVLRNLAKEYKASLSPEIIKKLDEDSREVKKQIDNIVTDAGVKFDKNGNLGNNITDPKLREILEKCQQIINDKGSSSVMVERATNILNSLSSWFASEETGPNETKIKLKFEPDHSKLYSKTGSQNSESYSNGDLVVSIDNKPSSIKENLRKSMNSVDSLFAKILNKCNDWGCLSSNDPPKIAEQEITIKDKSNEGGSERASSSASSGQQISPASSSASSGQQTTSASSSASAPGTSASSASSSASSGQQTTPASSGQQNEQVIKAGRITETSIPNPKNDKTIEVQKEIQKLEKNQKNLKKQLEKFDELYKSQIKNKN